MDKQISDEEKLGMCKEVQTQSGNAKSCTQTLRKDDHHMEQRSMKSNDPMPQEYPSEDSVDDFIMSSNNPVKRRKIHMTTEMCQTFSQSAEGGKGLALGNQLPNKDINISHLQPKAKRKRNSRFSIKNEKNQYKPYISKNHHPKSNVETKTENHVLNTNSSYKSGLVSSFVDGKFGGFTSAAKLHNDNPDLSSHFDVNQSTTPTTPVQSPRKKMFKSKDSTQKSITNFFVASDQISCSSSETPTGSSVTPPQERLKRNENLSKSGTIVISDSPISSPLKYEQIDYSSPVKMFSPIKKLEGSSTIYINDDSPSSSNSQTKRSKISVKDNRVVKQLFEGQKQYQSNKIAHGKGKRTNSKRSSNKMKPKDHVVKQETRQSISNISSEDDDMLCTAVDIASEKYGLLGTSSSFKTTAEKPLIDYFDNLPDELLEIIFAQLPMLDLCLNSNRVCCRWNQIISSERFVPWKKKYHRLKKNIPGTVADVKQILVKNNICRATDYLTGLIRYVKSFKPVTATNMLQCLQRHKKYNWAKALIEERLTDCLVHGEPNPWSCIATLVIISQNVYDIEEIIQCLLVPSSQCTSIEILESLYCIATILYVFKITKPDDVWNGIHYRLFYALYLFENASSTSLGDLQSAIINKKGQQSLMKYSQSDTVVKMTHEQTRIVNYNVQPGEIIKIVAFAGTGKTTTLVKYTKMRPSMRFLLVVYNKSVCQYANRQFPGNVVCKTGHGLAFQFTGRRYGAAMKLGNLKIYPITQALPLRKGDSLFVRAKIVMDTVNTFIASADPCITTDHVPNKRMDDNGQLIYTDPEKKSLYVKDAELIWSQMLDFKNKDIYMTHDGYLKIYQLSKPKLLDYDCILIDEAQDMSPALSDILMNQSQAKVLVGDPHQQIYAFRGAVNAMSRVSATNIFYLTQSFRFGPEIAHVASCCLETLKEEKLKTLVGNGKKCEVNGKSIGQVAIICRSNFTVFNEAVKKCCYSEGDFKVGFVGGTDGFGFPMLQDIYTLMIGPEQRQKEGRTIQDRLIKKFSNLGELEKYASKTQDHELSGKIKIVRTHHVNLLSHISRILNKCVKDNKVADFLFSTAHKAKGLEFSTVKVTDDYGVNPILQMLFRHIPEIAQAMPPNAREVNMDEGNLLYVAVTRAKHALQISPTLKTILSLCGERFEHPVCSKQLQQQGVTMKCRETDKEFKPYALSIQKEPIKLGDGNMIEGGVVSPIIITTQRKSLCQLYGLLEKDKEANPPVEQHGQYAMV